MPAKREQRHAVERLEDDSGRPEVGKSRRHANAHVRGDGRIDELKRRAADRAARDDHGANLVRLGDLADVLDGAQHRDPIHDVEARPRHLDEPADAVAHPRASLKGPGQGSGLVVRPGDQGDLACDRVAVQAVGQPPDAHPPGDDGNKARDQEDGDELASRIDIGLKGDQHHQKDGRNARVEEFPKLRGNVSRPAQVIEAVDGENDRPDRDGREDDPTKERNRRYLRLEEDVENRLREVVARDHRHHIHGERGDGDHQRPVVLSRGRFGGNR